MRSFLLHPVRILGLAAACLAVTPSAPQAQSFTKADSGWVRIFNGNNFDGFYSRTYGASAQMVIPPAAPYSIEYAGTDTAAIRVGTNSTSNGSGNIGTIDTTFSHYRVRYEGKFDVLGDVNAGITYHTDERKNRMNNNWPRSIEFQMRQTETGAAFSIQQVTANTRVTSGRYNPNGTNVTMCQYGCNARNYLGSVTISNGSGGVTRWLRYTLVVRGADTAMHIVNDTLVFKLWNIRIFNDSTQGSSNRTPNGPHDHGGLTWQAEGGPLRYRRLEVMRIPPTTPMTANFLHRLFLDAPAAPVKPAPGAQVALAWRSIGTLPKVKIEYRSGSAGWQTAVDSVPNTGSYNWTAPGSVPDSIRFRISSLDYVWPDSTAGPHPVSLRGGPVREASLLFRVSGGALVLSGAGNFDRAEIRDASGRMVRVLSGAAEVARWDLTGANGARVRPGLYFIRLTGSGAPLNGRAMVL